MLATCAHCFNDGFGNAKKLTGDHFTVYCASGIDPAQLADNLGIGLIDELLAGKSVKTGSSAKSSLTGMLDTFFAQIIDILDMPLYSYKGNIKICRDDAQLSQVYYSLFRSKINKRKAFYVHDLNTVYISAESFTREVLGHEIAHAVISNYFVVMPPMKVQEVLAGYVEFQLRKVRR
ncbi:hypothetical protein ACFL1K_02185 [Candidatus Omnitrophota bacterium]